jgi:hypothetical protein
LDLKKLTPGEMVIAVSGVVLLIFSFFKWYSIEFSILGQTVGASRNGWESPDAFFSVIAILIGIVMAAHVIVNKLAGVEMPERLGSFGWGVFYLAGGIIAFVFLLIKWLGNNDYVKFGFYISILASLGLAVGGFLTARERGDLAALQKGGSGGAGGAGGGSGGGGTPPAA